MWIRRYVKLPKKMGQLGGPKVTSFTSSTMICKVFGRRRCSMVCLDDRSRAAAAVLSRLEARACQRRGQDAGRLPGRPELAVHMCGTKVIGNANSSTQSCVAGTPRGWVRPFM